MLAVALGMFGACPPALAAVILFTFDPVPGVTEILTDGENNGAVENYMNQVLAQAGYPAASVDVTGAIADNNYTADNHLVGPKNGSVTPLALWNTDGSTTPNTDQSKWHLGTRDMFIMNRSGITTISMDFTGIDIDGVSFDLQIFPDGTCPSPPDPGCVNPGDTNWPDFNFWVNGSLIQSWDGVKPGQDGTYLYSPAKPNNGGETAPQLLTTSGYIDLNGGYTLNLDFVDWPAHIGIDNLRIYRAPEPGGMLLFGGGLLIAVGLRRRSARP